MDINTAEKSNPIHVNILWTGGLDSSYRMVELSRLDVTIQPYYMSDNRRSEKLELKAMKEIRQDIERHPETKCRVLPLKIIKVTDIEPDAEITAAYKRLAKIFGIGSQYDFLARFSKKVEGLELCFEKAENNNTFNVFHNNAVVKQQHNGPVSYVELDEEKTSADLFTVFSRFRFPLPLYEMTKLDEVEVFKKLGFADSVAKTWFCHKPMFGKPCGMCHPCQGVVSEGMSYRLPPVSMFRYRLEMKYGKKSWFRKLKELDRRING